jgi:dihydroneopterin aldolase
VRIHIRKLTFKTVIGILPHERKEPQRVVIDIEIDYDYDGKNYIDYAQICKNVEALMHHERFGLLEDAVRSLTAMICDAYAPHHCRVTIAKPDILPHADVAVSDTCGEKKHE